MSRPRAVVHLSHGQSDMAPRVILLVAILSIYLHHVVALNILAIVSLPLHSHYMAFQTLFRELAAKGHSVTVLNNFPDKNPSPNLQFVDLNQLKNFAGYISPLTYYENLDSTYLHWINFYKHIIFSPGSTQDDCTNFFTNEDAKAHFDKGVKYDVIFVEMFMGECGLAYAGAVYDAPIIGITSHVMLPSAYPRLGIPFNYGSDAFYFSRGGPNPSLYHKIEAVIMDSILHMYHKWYIHGKIKRIFDEYLPNNQLDIEQVAKERMKMMFVYQHFSLTGARLLAPQVLEIGGMHIGKPKPVPEQIDKFISEAKNGVIYVSFGSNLRANTMSEKKLQEFLNAFKRIPQKVVWKFENASLPAGNDNVFISNWLPQLDILCHPKVLGFVSHAGMLSLSEAAHCGKPVVVMPFFGDQFSNAVAARAVGLAHTLEFDRLNADNLVNGIREIMSSKMQETAKRISKQWHDRPMSVLDSAIYWTEYVARHNNAPPTLPLQRTAWYEKLLLDVVAVLVAIIFLVILVLRLVCKLLRFVVVSCLSIVFCKKKSKRD